MYGNSEPPNCQKDSALAAEGPTIATMPGGLGVGMVRNRVAQGAGVAMEPMTADDPVMVGGFRLRARLGAGGMGRVYLGTSVEAGVPSR